MKVNKLKKDSSPGFTPVDAGVEPEETEMDDKSYAELYEMYEQETMSRRKGATVPADMIRKFIHEVMEATEKDEVVLAAIVRAITKAIGKVENGSVRSAAQREFDLVNRDGVVYIQKR